MPVSPPKSAREPDKTPDVTTSITVDSVELKLEGKYVVVPFDEYMRLLELVSAVDRGELLPKEEVIQKSRQSVSRVVGLINEALSKEQG